MSISHCFFVFLAFNTNVFHQLNSVFLSPVKRMRIDLRISEWGFYTKHWVKSGFHFHVQDMNWLKSYSVKKNIHLQISICRCPPVDIHLQIFSCIYQLAAIHLQKFHLQIFSCIYPPAAIYLQLSTCRNPPVDIHLQISTWPFLYCYMFF